MGSDKLPPFITVERAAELISMPESWVYESCRRYRRSGRGIPNKKFGRAVRIHRDGMLKWVDSL